MLDLYKEEQPIAYKIIKNAIDNNKHSHAYLIETKGLPIGLDFACALAKALICPQKYTNNTQCNGCTRCQNIDLGNYSEVKIIERDGQWIKKEQLIELQNDFSKTAVLGDKKVYIINNAEMLNAYSANSILKFIEEPEDNIIGILVADNANQLLETIRSRMQIISLRGKKVDESENILFKIGSRLFSKQLDLNNFIENDKNIDFIKKVMDFADYYEQRGLATILNTQKLILNTIKEKETMSLFLNVLILYYKDVLNYKIGRDLEIFNDYKKNILVIVDKNGIEQICKKINIIMELCDKIRMNMNLNLLVDKLILKMEGERNE